MATDELLVAAALVAHRRTDLQRPLGDVAGERGREARVVHVHLGHSHARLLLLHLGLPRRPTWLWLVAIWLRAT